MKVLSTALTATYTSLVSLLGLDTNGPIGFGVSVGETSSDAFTLWGTLDAALVAGTDPNAQNLGQFSGGAGNLPKGIADQAKTWPCLFVQRTGGSTAGSFFVAGNPAASPAVVSTAAPVAAGNYSALMTLTTLGAQWIRIGGSAAMTSSDVFDVFLSNDSTLAASTGAYYAGQITGGGGTLLISVLESGYNYAIIQRVRGSTAGNIIAAGVSPSSGGGGGVLNLTTLAVGDTAVNGPIGALTAAQSVDIYSSFLLTQTTAGVTATLPNPTITTAGKVALVMNASTAAQPITMYGMTIGVGAVQLFEWTGAAWVGGKNITQGGNAFGATVTIGSTDNQAVSVVSGTGATNVGAQASAHPTTLGGTTGASRTTLQGGSLGILVQTTGSGAVQNSASQVDTPPLSPIADGTGSLGTAATTVDVASVLLVNQTTPVVLYANMRLIQPPTDATLIGRRLKIVNVGTAAFIVGDATQKQGINLIPGTTPGGAALANTGQACCFTWNGTAWVPDDTGLGVPVVAAGLADGSASIPRAGRYTIYRAATWTGNNTLTASLTGALIGDYIDIIRDDGTQAVTMTINNAAAAALVVAPASKKATIRIAYLGTGDWQLAGGGAF